MAEKKQPWMKWYPSDWRSEPALRMVSRSARSLWMDMLGLMHEAEPYGELRLNGRALTAAGLAALLGDRVSDVSRWLLELKVAGVSSENSDGVIFSRRMVRDKANSLKKKENGLKGGNPLLKQKDKHGDKEEDKPQKPEARIQKPEEIESSAGADVPVPNFSEFWAAYPTDRNMSRKAAEQRWAKLPPEKRRAALEAIPGFRAYCQANGWYRPVHAERFLSQERFEGYARDANIGPVSEDAARRAWNGEAAKLIDALGDRGATLFASWFNGANFEPGPPRRIILPNPGRRAQVERQFSGQLRKAFGDFVLEVGA